MLCKAFINWGLLFVLIYTFGKSPLSCHLTILANKGYKIPTCGDGYCESTGFSLVSRVITEDVRHGGSPYREGISWGCCSGHKVGLSGNVKGSWLGEEDWGTGGTEFHFLEYVVRTVDGRWGGVN